MRVLVAGGAGFIGGHVCRKLLGQGHEVICLDNLSSGRRQNVEELLAHERFSFLRQDVCQTPEMAVDLILHLASPASPVHYRRYPIETMLANSAGTQRLLELAAACGARFVFASTSEVYGNPLEHPQREEYRGNVNPLGPRACYDESKRFGETLTMEYQRRFGVNASIARLFNTYGPGMAADDGRVIPAFITAALEEQPLPMQGDGSQTRSFCYISDLVEGLLLLTLDNSAAGLVVNIGNPEEIAIRELGEEVRRLTGSKGGTRFLAAAPDEPERRRPDIRRMRERYGWEPRVGLREGLELTIAYFRESSRMAATAP